MIEKLKEWSGPIALVAIVLSFLFVGHAPVAGAIRDTSYFDFFNAATGGGFQINGTTVLSAAGLSLTAATSNVIAGAIVQTGGTAAVAVFPGTIVANNVTYGSGGYSQTLSTNTTVTVAQFCAGTAVLIPVGSPAITITLPAATSTYSTSPGGCTTVGGWSNQIIENESSNTVTLATTTGMNNGDMNFYYATGTPAVYPPKILATTTVYLTGIVSTSTPRVLENVYLTYFNRPY